MMTWLCHSEHGSEEKERTMNYHEAAQEKKNGANDTRKARRWKDCEGGDLQEILVLRRAGMAAYATAVGSVDGLDRSANLANFDHRTLRKSS